MAARGTASKEQIIAKILETFPGAFRYDKEIRIPMNEDGEIIQIKCTLTAAKTNVESGGDTVTPGDAIVKDASPVVKTTMTPSEMEPTAEEKQAVADLISKLGLA